MKARHRAWLFLHPDLDVSEPEAGLQIAPRGNIAMVEGGDSVRQAILLLLSTMPGERVMRPEYGCNLHQLVFAPNDDTTAGLAIHYVQRALERWEPRIEILRLDAGRNPHRPELLDLVLEYRVLATQRVEELTFSLNLAEGEV
ncbi:MAG: GPW/gp25 family protein [Anaerolineae bacterium]